MLYAAFRAAATLALRLFFVVEKPVDAEGALALEGPVIFVGNHPNGLIDPGLLFMLAQRQVTFLAKAPLFSIPALGWVLRSVGALPVFRKQDGADTTQNEGVLAAAAGALARGRAISIFPEGKSHSEPQLAELKTGCARIALDALARGAEVRVVPVGLTYSQKNRFKSRVHVEVGAPIAVKAFAPTPGEAPRDTVRRLTEAISEALRAVTLNLEAWEDLPIIQTAEELYALAQGQPAGAPERHQAFARGVVLLREEQPDRFERLKQALASFRSRLDLLRVSAGEVAYPYRPTTVATFILRNLLWLLGLPVWLVGMLAFALPYWLPKTVVALTHPKDDTESTVKVLTSMVLAPVWWALLTVSAWATLGALGGVAALLGVPPLALFTRWYTERRGAALHDARVFFIFWSRRRLKARLLAEGNALSTEVASVAQELRGRVVSAALG